MTMQSASPQQLLFGCDHCGVTFQRREHLNRHVRCHLQRKPFTCHHCGKSFSRQDTLKRHTVTHGHQYDGLSKRALKACSECTRSKQRCSETVPCDRCTRRGLLCHFSKPSTEMPESRDVGPQDEHLDVSQIEDGNGPSHLHLSHPSAHGESAAIVSGNDLLSQYEFPWISQGFAFPFASPFEIDPTSASDVMFYCDHPPLPFEDPVGVCADDPIASTPQHIKHGGTISTPDSLSDESHRQRNRATPMRNQNNQAEPFFPGFPHFSPDDIDLIVSDDHCHVLEVSESDYEELLRLYHKSVQPSSCENKANLPRREIINAFVQLYFQFFHSSFPLLHQATFQRPQRSSCLFLAVAAIGSQYSRVTSRGQCNLALLEILRRSLLNDIKLDCPPKHDLQLVQATILCTFALSFCGRQRTLAQAQYLRSLLVTMCRPFMTQSILYPGWAPQQTDSVRESSFDWVARESWARVIYFTWYIEYLHWTFFDLAPLISVSELHACLPCDDELWQKYDPTEISNLIPADILPPYSPSVLDVLNANNSGKEPTSSLGSSASLFTMISTCAKERSLFQILKPVLTDGSINEPGAAIAALCAAHSEQTKMLADQAIANVAGNLLQYRVAPDETSASSGSFSAMKKIYSISRILDHVPYTLLYVSSGWMASKRDTETSLENLKKRLRSNPPMSRRTLTYAAQVFRRIRNQRRLEACDPLYVLLVTLDIWYYGSIFESPTDSDSSTWSPLKIDDEVIDETVWMQWVNTGDKRRPHVAGIGFLNGNKNGHRVLKEAIRILSNGQGWQHFAHAVAGSLQRILSGVAPSFTYS